MNRNHFIPIIIAASLVAGIVVGTFLANRFSGNRLNIINTSSNKLNDLLHIIDDQYVDTVNVGELVEDAMPQILSELDPHSSYISAKDAETANDDLRGSFSGIGVQFTIKHDTVYVSNVIHGGPSERVGILPGDRIVAVNDSPYVGKVVTSEETMHRLKGPEGTTVKLGIVRHGERKSFSIVRGNIPVKSIDGSFMLDDELGYIRVKSFGETTYPELLTALATLESQRFRGLVVDLRGNGGGYLGAAIRLVNEFLPAGKLIVYTQGRKVKREDYHSDGHGSYQRIPLIVLTDETTASAAEIFSGAIQDNDRGVIVGRRTFGKGLVQQPISFSDGSLIHLTIARYYTPSGRCIQKPYTKGQQEDYEMDIVTRYNHGEFFNEDSIQQSGEKFHTSIGRTVYGGGGIMPDYFVAEDTTAFTPYYNECVSKGYVMEFCFNYTDQNRQQLSAFNTPEMLVNYLRHQHLVEQFARYADSKGVQRRNNMIRKSQQLFEDAIYGNIVYNILDMEAYLKYMSRKDVTIEKAIELYKQKETVPTLPQKEKDEKEKKVAKTATPQVLPFRDCLC